MMKFKKLTALLLAAVMALAMLTACGNGGGGNSTTEKERYIKGINRCLREYDSRYEELVYDRDVDKQAKTYQENYEALVKGGLSSKTAKNNARKVADITDGDYQVIQFEVNKKLSESKKINFIADEIEDALGESALLYGQWKIGYVWGANDSKKETQPIYIVLKIANAVG